MRTTPARTRLSPRLRAAFVALLIAGTSGTAVAATARHGRRRRPRVRRAEQGRDQYKGVNRADPA